MSLQATPPDGPAAHGAVKPAPDLLDAEELSRVRMFASLGVVLPVGLLALLPFLGGDARARTVFGVSLLLAAVGSGWLFWSAHREERYDVWRLLLAGALWLAAALAGLRYFGALSPIAIVLPLGVFFFGMTRDVRARTAAYVVVALSYFLIAVPSLRGSIQTGVSAGSLTRAQAITLVAVAEIALAISFVTARAVRSNTMLALARHERITWALVQKEALLLEVQKDLARALDVAGVGRFSETVVGKYRLAGVLGRGAMGEVYEAHHLETHREAAVKLLHTHTLREPGSVQRFLREANMAAALDTPHAVQILEVGGFDGELPYLAMERLRGEDLAELLRRRPTLSVAEVLRLLSEIGAGLAAARAAGVVHRDVKPRNLFLSATDAPEEPGAERKRTLWKLLDFGVSKFAAAEATHADGRIIGTPEYMAPEQAGGEPVTHRTDLFSLGAVVYRALTGSQPFSGDHVVEVLYKVVHTMPPRPSALTDLGPEVDLVLAVALAKSPGDRFDSAEELRDALAAASRGEISPDLRARGQKVLAAFPWGEASSVEG